MKQSSIKAIIIGALGSALGGGLLLFFTNGLFASLWAFITTCLIWIWDGLNENYGLSGWLWIPIIILTIIGLITIVSLFKSEPNSIEKKPEYYNYNEDFIKNAKWRWAWSHSIIANLWCYCPDCDATLVCNDPSVRDFLSNEIGTKFICENCNKVVAKIDSGDKNYALEFIKREIDRRVRTNEYKTHKQGHLNRTKTVD